MARKGKFGIAGLVLGAALSFLPAAHADEKPSEWSGWANANIVSSYLGGNSGNVISKNPSVQPCIGATRKDGLTFSVWSDYTLGDKDTALGDKDTDAKFTEVDPAVDIPFPKDWKVNGNLYAGLFILPDGSATGEVGVNISPKKEILGLNTNLYIGQAVLKSGANGRVVKGSVGKTFNLTDKLSATLGGDLAYADDYSGADGLSHAGLNGKLAYSLGDNWSINAGVRQQLPIRDSADDYTVGTIGISKSFSF